jgi:hypothetical protein
MCAQQALKNLDPSRADCGELKETELWVIVGMDEILLRAGAQKSAREVKSRTHN